MPKHSRAPILHRTICTDVILYPCFCVLLLLHVQGAGRVAAHGTPMELKAAHGEGYTLTLSLCSPPPPPTPSNSYAQLAQAAAPGAATHPPLQLQSALGMTNLQPAAGRMEALEALVQVRTGIRDSCIGVGWYGHACGWVGGGGIGGVPLMILYLLG